MTPTPEPPTPIPPTPTFFTKLVDLNLNQEITDMYLLMPQTGWNGAGDSGQGTMQTIMTFRNDSGLETKRFVFAPSSHDFGWDYGAIVEPIARYDAGESQMEWGCPYFMNLTTSRYTYNQINYYYLQLDTSRFDSGGVIVNSKNTTDFPTDQNFNDWLNSCYVINELV